MNLVKSKIVEKPLIHIIRKWLKAGILDKGTMHKPKSGSPQGGVLSPLLSNIYLNEVDKVWDNRDGFYTRYADDIVVQCYNKAQAEKALAKLTVMLEELGLTLNKEKTCIRHLEESFDFLGFTFKEAENRVLKRKVRIKFPKPKSMKAIRSKVKERVKSFPLGVDIRVVTDDLNKLLRGWANYFKVGNSYKAANNLSSYACQQLRIFWRRCHQCKQKQGTQKWPNAYFYNKGLCYVPSLIK
jgi:RNA-directed DNA polymerase